MNGHALVLQNAHAGFRNTQRGGYLVLARWLGGVWFVHVSPYEMGCYWRLRGG